MGPPHKEGPIRGRADLALADFASGLGWFRAGSCPEHIPSADAIRDKT